MKVKSESEVVQLCPTLRDPMDCSLPGSSTHGIFQARVLEWVAIAFSGVHTYDTAILFLDLYSKSILEHVMVIIVIAYLCSKELKEIWAFILGR